MNDDGRGALVLFSGGQDSTACLAWALARFDRVETIGFDYGQRHRIELDCRHVVRTALAAELETIGRKTGQVRRVPVSVQFDDEGAWVICQHGTRSGWGSNIVDNPNVRVRQGDRWRSGVAHLRPDDDVVARARKFGRLGAAVVKTLETTPISVRIDFTD